MIQLQCEEGCPDTNARLSGKAPCGEDFGVISLIFFACVSVGVEIGSLQYEVML